MAKAKNIHNTKKHKKALWKLTLLIQSIKQSIEQNTVVEKIR